MRLFVTYLKINAIILSAGLSFLLLCNLIIDPEGRFSLVDIPGVNHEKTEVMAIGGRTVKARTLEQGTYDTIFLGTSRVNFGLNPRSLPLGTRRAYNAALPGTSLPELAQIFAFARTTNRIKTVVLGLDFTLFSDKRAIGSDFTDSPFAGTNSWLSDLKYLASFQTFLSSVTTARDNRKGRKATDTESGLADHPPRSESGQIDHRALFIRVLTRHYMVKEETYGGFSYSLDRLDLLHSIVEQCRADGIELYLFIPPVHARDLETLRALGLYPLFEQWQRDLVAILAADAAAHPEEKRIPLWDFTGYTSITTEDVPSAGEKGKQMQWYWESSHFKKELGDLVLDRIFDYRELGHIVPEDFGIQITTVNIEAHLAWIREQRTRYHQIHPQEVTEVEYLAKITERFRAHPSDVDGRARKER